MLRLRVSIMFLVVLVIGAWPAQARQIGAVEGNTAFAFDLYQALRTENDGNLFFSPYSISTALAMTYAGARGTTEQQMAEVMHFTLPQDELHPAFSELQQTIGQSATTDDAFRLNVVNALWGQENYAFRPDYLDLVDQNYGGGLRQVNFKSDPEAARQVINQWVADQTEQRIKDLLPEEVITTDTRLVLTNAIYFKASWLFQFDPEFTQDGPFTLLDGSTVTVPLMINADSFGYLEGDGFQAVQLPYEGNRAAMLIILPDEGRFEEIESGLNAETFTTLIDSLTYGEVSLTMPRFEYTSEFRLDEALKAMGMMDAFIYGVADFSGIADLEVTGEPLFISAVIHKAFVKVDETGTEAAAATAVVIATESAMMPLAEVTINRPFIFFITDQQTGSVLFMGRVMNPTE